MNVKTFLKALDFAPSKKETESLKKEASLLIGAIKKSAAKKKIKVELFIGGSLAKGTLVKKEVSDIDIFARFAPSKKDLSDLLESILEKASKEMNYKMTRVHGSRDYFKLQKKKELVFEIVPVLKIKKPKEAQNVTDLSYFHVNYLENKVNKNGISKQIVLAKAFCKAQKVYGAESYIGGFSGYGLECLIVYYKSFENMAKAIVKAKGKLIIDSEKMYKNENDVLLEINESKLQSPIVLVDPTWKERNVLAALSEESFKIFQSALKNFLIGPNIKFFEEKKGIEKETMKNFARKMNAKFIETTLKTDRQAGDIAGTKLKKFYSLLINEIEDKFTILKKDFEYEGEKTAKVCLVLKSKKENIVRGPFISLIQDNLAFKKKHKDIFEKEGRLYAREKIKESIEKFIENYKKNQKNKINSMGITEVVVE